MPPVPKKPNRLLTFFVNLWRRLTGKNKEPQYQGTSRSRVLTTPANRHYDLEITEFPIRDVAKARELIELREYCPEMATAIQIISDDVQSSYDGDDQGVAISDTDELDQAIDPEVKRLSSDLLLRVFPSDRIEMICDRMLSYGDCFGELDIDISGKQVNSIQLLPTWECFRVEERGQLIRFEQRRLLQDDSAIELHPVKMLHWRFQPKYLYGRSLFNESLEDWSKLKEAVEDLFMATRETGVNPIKHRMPVGATADYRDAYRDHHEERLADGIITNYYLLEGEDVERLSTTYPDLSTIANAVLLWRSRIAMRSRVPLYLLGIKTDAGKEIAGQPALSYIRMVNRIRQRLSSEMRRAIDLELLLNDIPQELWKYRIVWPKLAQTVMQQPGEVDDEGPQEDTEETNRIRRTERMYAESI